MLTRDVEIKSTHTKQLLLSKHIEYLQQYANNNSSDVNINDKLSANDPNINITYEQLMVEYLRMSGIYWTITALHLMQYEFNEDAKQSVLTLIGSCVDSRGGISASIGHDSHILYTLSAIQILVEFNALDHNIIDIDKTVCYISSLQKSDGSFAGDKWGEIDVRFSFCAIASLALLKRLNAIDVPKAIDYIMSCYNTIDGGFGSRPGSESHAGLIYCCLGSLAITGELDRIDADLLGWWLAERQLPSGGLCGRPEKLPDLCYSWWVLASLAIIGRLHWIDKRKLLRFILACQDEESGGFSDRPGNMVDPFHTLFGTAGLSLITHEDFDDERTDISETDDEMNSQFDIIRHKINVINPVFCMPQSVIDKCNIKSLLANIAVTIVE